MTYRKKLIEVALPLEAINKASAREKSIRHGHPSTLHLWWARRPLAACRAVLFGQLVDDPSAHPEQFPTEAAQELERQRLFRIIEDLVQWENMDNEEVLERARAEIRRSAGPEGPPPLLDPFAGGGSIPLEAQRLGLEAHASDLNPVAVLINKALIEIPPRFAGMPPVHPGQPRRLIEKQWKGAEGLAEDVRYYGQWMRDEAEKRIGHLYPKVQITEELLGERPDLREQGLQAGDELTVIAWLWARTVKCPNLACGAQMPLVRSFWLSKKESNKAWLRPVVDVSSSPPYVRFEVRTGTGKPASPPKVGRGARFRCLACGQIAGEAGVRAEFQAKRNGTQLMAIVVEGAVGRLYLPPNDEHVKIAESAEPAWKPDEPMNQENPTLVSGRGYGFVWWHEVFTQRQLVALTCLCDLISDAWESANCDARSAGVANPSDYADAVATYLAFGLDKNALTNCAHATWQSQPDRLTQAYGRQALPMTWDYAEANPLSRAGGGYELTSQAIAEVLWKLPDSSQITRGSVSQADASSVVTSQPVCVSTDPPYYDNIDYADLSDFFYVWLRRSLGEIYPELFGTLLVPKAEELVAAPHRFDGDKEKAQQFFEEGLARTFSRIYDIVRSDYPITVYYAFRQTETEAVDTSAFGATVASTGWETMLEGLIRSGFVVTGTWPVRTELVTSLKKNVSALASSIVIVCRLRFEDAVLATRRDFLNALRRELPAALRNLQRGNIAPVDMAQASIGPGMAVYSRYRRVLEADGTPMRVRTALALINQALDEYLSEQESAYDPATRWALAWFKQYAFGEGLFGDAETLSKAKNTSVEGMVASGIVQARAGKVRLQRREALAADWDPAQARRLSVWEVTQHLIRTMQTEGERAAAGLAAQVGGLAETARDLAYRLYTVCERRGWAQEAMPYNALVVGWGEIGRLAEERRREGLVQAEFGLE